MGHLHVGIIVFLLISGFFASFIDSIVGGGGLVSLPALILTGIPPSVALGTNKFASSMSSLTSTISYFRSGKINLRVVGYLFPLSLAGSVAGAFTVRQVPSDFLRPTVVILLILVTVYTVFKKSWGSETTFTRHSRKSGFLTVLAALVIGFYDGFFGPGTGSFLIFAFLLLRFDFVAASGNAKVLNFASNIGALVTFLFMHSIYFSYGLIMGLSMILGAAVGSQFAIRKGVLFVKPIFVVVTLVLVGKQVWTLMQ